jgi:hypothetical protein
MLAAATFAFRVMDKEWPLWQVIAVLLGLGLVGMLFCRKWPMTAVVTVPLIILVGIALVGELNDPFVGEAIRDEAGIRYVLLSYLAIAGSLSLVVLGTMQGWARRRRPAK